LSDHGSTGIVGANVVTTSGENLVVRQEKDKVSNNIVLFYSYFRHFITILFYSINLFPNYYARLLSLPALLFLLFRPIRPLLVQLKILLLLRKQGRTPRVYPPLLLSVLVFRVIASVILIR
jgi:hypothetical protein